MEWNDLPDSELSKLLKAKKLAHPTSATFDGDAWIAALDALTPPTERDTDLALAALQFGSEIASLRNTAIPSTIEGYNRETLIKLMVAFSNQQYLTVKSNTIDKLKTKKRGRAIDIERDFQVLIPGAGDQEATPDDLITYLVDSLPHWLFHIWKKCNDDINPNKPEDAIQFAGRASQITSLEHALRDLWLNALWLGTTLYQDGDALVDAHRDRFLAERWFIFEQRQMMLMLVEHHIDIGASIMTDGKLPPVEPAIAKTVIRMERPPSGHRKFITGRALGSKPEQRGRVSERDMLNRLYTGLFLDEKLPHFPGGDQTCRNLNKAWWVLQDLSRLAADNLGSAWFEDEKGMERFAITVPDKDLTRILADCLSIDQEQTSKIVDWFTCDPNNTSELFAKSFWSQPLLPDPGSDRRHIMLAPLLVGSPVRRIEAWMQRGGISDSHGIKGRGKPFERHVRATLAAALLDNELLTDAQIAEHGLKRKHGSEEIDLLIRIGDAVIVGEVKCFAAPSEAIEKHNHLRNLSNATLQAATKRTWAEANREAVSEILGITDPLRIASLKIHPLVVINHGFGIGLERNGVPIVDLHYLRLILSAGSYQGDTRYERGLGMAYQPIQLYGSQAQFETRLNELLRDPPPLKRYENTLRWRRLPFRTSDNTPFFIEIPSISEVPVPNALRDMPPLLRQNRAS